MRSTAGLRGLVLVPMALLLVAPSALAAPATEAEMGFYTRIAALNLCIARAAGVEFDKAAAVAGETIAQVIQGQHGGLIAQVSSKPLTLEELRKGATNSAVLGAVEICSKEVPAEVRKKVAEVLKTSETSGSRPAAAAPAAKP